MPVPPPPAELPAMLRRAAGRLALIRRLLEPAEVVLAGPPNVGKSTLANALIGRQVSLVHDQAGTTRDWVRHLAVLCGVPVHVTDTAGLWDAPAGVDAQAVGRAAPADRACRRGPPARGRPANPAAGMAGGKRRRRRRHTRFPREPRPRRKGRARREPRATPSARVRPRGHQDRCSCRPSAAPTPAARHRRRPGRSGPANRGGPGPGRGQSGPRRPRRLHAASGRPPRPRRGRHRQRPPRRGTPVPIRNPGRVDPGSARRESHRRGAENAERENMMEMEGGRFDLGEPDTGRHAGASRSRKRRSGRLRLRGKTRDRRGLPCSTPRPSSARLLLSSFPFLTSASYAPLRSIHSPAPARRTLTRWADTRRWPSAVLGVAGRSRAIGHGGFHRHGGGQATCLPGDEAARHHAEGALDVPVRADASPGHPHVVQPARRQAAVGNAVAFPGWYRRLWYSSRNCSYLALSGWEAWMSTG